MRRVLPILLFVLLAAFCAKGQDARNLHEDAQEKVKVYPNPAQSYVTIDLQNNYQKGLTIVVYSFLGKKMYENQNVAEKTTLTLTDYNRGIYVYHITDPAGKILFTGKFQVSR